MSDTVKQIASDVQLRMAMTKPLTVTECTEYIREKLSPESAH